MKALIITFLLLGQDLTLKPNYSVEPGQFLVIQPDTKAAEVKYVPLAEGLTILDANLLKDKKTLVCTALKPGSYRLLAYTALENKPSDPVFTTITVGQKAPPSDFAEILKAVYGADISPNKKKSLDKITKGLKEALAQSNDIKNNSELNNLLRKCISAKLEQGELEAVRSVLKDYLAAQFGTDADAALDSDKVKNTLTFLAETFGQIQ